MKKIVAGCIITFTVCLGAFSSQASAAGVQPETEVPAELAGEFQQLLGFVGYGRKDPTGFRPERIAGLIEFVDRNKDSHRLYHAGSPKGVASAYYEVDIRRNMDHVLRLTYSTEIPEVFTAPSTLRASHWTSVDGPQRRLPALWQSADRRPAPLFFTGIEHLVNTPDQTTGAYYEYDLYRTVILSEVNGRRLLISLSKQTGVSEVGKKGLIVGPDDHWDYLYTGEQGLNRFGIGWAKTYMYDSYSAAFYLEPADGAKSKVRFGVFKWLRAGWADMNIVKPEHIHAGLARYALAYKRIMEHPRLAEPAVLERNFAAMRVLSVDRLRELARNYVSELGKQVRANKLLSQEEATELFDKEGYLRSMNRQELESILTSEYLKQLLGKPYRVDLLQSLARR